LETRYKKDPSIVFRRIADEVILVPVRRRAADMESVFTLNDTAAAIWELVDGERSLCDIRDAIVQEYDVTEEEAEADLLAFLQELRQIDAVAAK
jgi:hypothetical protein